MVSAVSTFLAVLAFLSCTFIAITLLTFVAKKWLRLPCFGRLHKAASPFWLEFVMIVALVSTLGSLFYSEVAHFTPCVLCWYQRILMYPQPLLAYLALVRKERTFIKPYLVAMSLVGFAVALYHNAIQWLPTLFPLAPCDASGVSCAKIYPVAFGWVTIPMMSATAFALLLTILLVYGRPSKK